MGLEITFDLLGVLYHQVSSNNTAIEYLVLLCLVIFRFGLCSD